MEGCVTEERVYCVRTIMEQATRNYAQYVMRCERRAAEAAEEAASARREYKKMADRLQGTR